MTLSPLFQPFFTACGTALFFALSLTAGVLLLLNLVYVLRSRATAPTSIKAEILLMKMQMGM